MNSAEPHATATLAWPPAGPNGRVDSAALVADGNPASRTALASMLRRLGVGTIVRTTRALQARQLIEEQHFDIVICEYHFENQPMTGQDLLDDLRQAHLLPLSTVVVMISGEAAYAQVAGAAEAALDAYLIKPHTEQALHDRLLQAMERKAALRDIIDCVDRGELAEAAQLCQHRCDERGPNWLNAARIGAELWLRLGQAQAAHDLFEQIVSTQALPWARLGYARCAHEVGAVQQARLTLDALIHDQPGYADAYDVMGRVLLDQGHVEEALRALRRATALTPGNVSRLLQLGTIAFFHGDRREAVASLQQAITLGSKSKVFDPQGFVLLGMLQFDRGDLRGLAQSLRSLGAAHAQEPNNTRLRRFVARLATFKMLLERRIPDAIRAVRDALHELREPDFDFEAACDLLCLLARMQGREVRLEEARERVLTIADRFAVSRATCELLCRAVQGQAGFDALIRARYERICAHAEQAISRTVGGAPREAVRTLLDRFESTLNTKMLDLALHTLARHRRDIDGAEALLARAQALQAGAQGSSRSTSPSRIAQRTTAETSPSPSLAISRLR